MGGSSSEDLDSLSQMSYDDYWIGDFMHRRENQGIIRIHDEFLEDRFNIVGLSRYVRNLEKTYSSILDKGPRGNFSEESVLYYLIHQRYIFTKPGLEAVLDKVMNKEYGVCPRWGCESVPVIPVGLSNEPKVSSSKVYCYNCVNVYEPRNTLCILDGCAWGTSFPHFLILTYSYHFVPKEYGEYVPRIYGFRICVQDENDSFEEES